MQEKVKIKSEESDSKNKEVKKGKLKRFFIGLAIAVISLVILGFYEQLTFNKPAILLDTKLSQVGKIEEFEFSVRKSNHIIGLAINDKSVNMSFGIDGNYTIEYFRNDKFLKKEIINQETLPKYYKGLYHISGSSSLSSWKRRMLGQIKQSGRYRIIITVDKPESVLKNFKGDLYFFADNSNLKMMQKFNSINTPQVQAENKRKRLLKNLIDANETNETLSSFRKALDSNNFEKVKKIINADNNITVNTDMVFHRRALDYASFQNSIEITKYLIDNGADIHHKDEMGKNALAYAIENNSTKTAKLLIDSGIGVNEVVFVQNYLQYKIRSRFDKEQVMSALQYTASNALFEMTELLLKNAMQDNVIVSEGANINIDTYIHSRTKMNKEEKEKMLNLFEHYGVKVENLNQQKSLFNQKEK